MRLILTTITIAFAAATAPALAQPYDPAARIAAQTEAMKKLAFMDGEWRGPAQVQGGPELIQTERIGSLLGGVVKVIEGRGYQADGSTGFNALGVISYDIERKAYVMRSYAMGYAGEYPLELTGTGFRWETPAGPGARIRYTATVDATNWHEIGERIAGDAAPVTTFEMRLKRIGASAWPGAGAVPPKP